jgi:predicted lipoprotein with Yx(FWY)xxD motif
MRINVRPGSGRWRSLALIIGAGAFLAACGSNTTGAASTPAAPPAAAGASSGGPGSSGSPAVVMTHSGPLGTYLTDASGRTLYLFATDTGSNSTCAGTCAANWPPLTTTGAPQAGSGTTGSDLSTTMRADGSTQVDYHGHPLYYFAADTSAGDAKGQGLNEGGLWWVVSPAGAAITSSAATSSTPNGGGGSDTAWS